MGKKPAGIWIAQGGMPMDTRNEGGHIPLAAHNSEENFGNRWWLRSQHLMKEPSTSGKVGKENQERR